jgi:uncharacterized protein DUF1707
VTSPDGPQVRIGDADREAAVSALGEHYAAGRLTKEEFDERSDQAWAARTASGLWPLFADLPRPVAAPQPVSRPAGRTRGSERGHPGWWMGARWAPLLLVVLGLVVLTHAPLFLLVLLVWLFLARSGRHWAHSRGRSDWSRGGPAPWSQRR